MTRYDFPRLASSAPLRYAPGVEIRAAPHRHASPFPPLPLLRIPERRGEPNPVPAQHHELPLRPW